jgi:hypothetical protein
VLPAVVEIDPVAISGRTMVQLSIPLKFYVGT